MATNSLEIPASIAERFNVLLDDELAEYIQCQRGKVYKVCVGRWRFELQNKFIDSYILAKLKAFTIGHRFETNFATCGIVAGSDLYNVLGILGAVEAGEE